MKDPFDSFPMQLKRFAPGMGQGMEAFVNRPSEDGGLVAIEDLIPVAIESGDAKIVEAITDKGVALLNDKLTEAGKEETGTDSDQKVA